MDSDEHPESVLRVREEKKMEFLQSYWVLLVVVLLFFGLQAVGVGCCGGGHRNRAKGSTEKETKAGGEKSCH